MKSRGFREGRATKGRKRRLIAAVKPAIYPFRTNDAGILGAQVSRAAKRIVRGGEGKPMIGHFITACASYASVIAVMYLIGQKAEAFLSTETIRKVYLFSKDSPVAKTLGATILLVSTMLDTALRFRKRGKIHTPAFWRSVTLSLVMFGMVLYPLRDFPIILVVWIGVTPAMLFNVGAPSDVWDLDLFFAFLLLPFIIANILSDYVSFSKSRSLLAAVDEDASLPRLAMILCIDLALSVLIAVIVSLAVCSWFMQLVNLLETTDDRIMRAARVLGPIFICGSVAFGMARRYSPMVIILVCAAIVISIAFVTWAVIFGAYGPVGFGEVASTMVMSALPFAFGAPFYSAATGLGVTVITALACFITLLRRGASRLEGKAIWKVLEFKEKPMRAAAALSIVLFTLLYWPIVLVGFSSADQ